MFPKKKKKKKESKLNKYSRVLIERNKKKTLNIKAYRVCCPEGNDSMPNRTLSLFRERERERERYNINANFLWLTHHSDIYNSS